MMTNVGYFYIVFFIVCFLIFLLVELKFYFTLLYVFQLSGYHVSSIFSSIIFIFKNYYLLIIIYLLLSLIVLFLDFESLLITYLFVLLFVCILFFVGKGFKNLFKIKYTKRMIRLIVCSICVFVLFCILMYEFVSGFYLSITLFLVVVFNYIIFFLSYCIMFPIEYLIGQYYISKAKNKLRENKRIIKIGITGSFGKTSTKEILATILSEEYNVLATPKSFNTPFGVSKTINNDLRTTHEIFICEMGAKKKNEIKYLCDFIDVDYGVVTAVGRQHTSTFRSIDNIYNTKKELPDYVSDKVCVFNLMNFYTKRMYDCFVGKKIGVFLIKNSKVVCPKVLKRKHIFKQCYNNIIYFSKLLCFNKSNNVYAKNIQIDEFGMKFDICYNGEFVCKAQSILLGLHNVINILLAVGMSKALNVSNHNIEVGIKKIKPIKARLEKFVTKNGAIVLNNGYNSNIDAVKYSLETLKLFNRANKVVITPGLIESEDDYEYNKMLGEKISYYCTSVIIVKKTNKLALLHGLSSSGFDMRNVICVKSFTDARKIFENAGRDYVYLIENDLPDNFR